MKAPWPLNGRLDQRDPRLAADPDIAPYGCAMMLTFAAGTWLMDREPPAADQVLSLHAQGVQQGIIEDECFVRRWARAINLAAGMVVVTYAGPEGEPPDSHDPYDYPFKPGELVFDCWWRPSRPQIGFHFTWSHPEQYDPLGSFAPGLSNSRQYGVVHSRRAFRIIAGPRAA